MPYANDERKRRINQLRTSLLAAAGHEISEAKVIGVCAIDFGLTSKVVLEYLKQLEAAGLIIRKEGIITIPDAAP